MRESTPINPRLMTLAIVQALSTWTDAFYAPFFTGKGRAVINQKWFDYFQKDWKVGRTIKARKKEIVREYFRTCFRQALNRKPNPRIIDEATDLFQANKWGSKAKGKGSRPISIISKVGFFLQPDILVPRDRYALQGLKNLGLAPGETYVEYLRAFNTNLQKHAAEIKAALASDWVTGLAHSLGCPIGQLRSRAFKRKVFDNYLMHLGGFKGQKSRIDE